jgi:hypothetical protein
MSATSDSCNLLQFCQGIRENFSYDSLLLRVFKMIRFALLVLSGVSLFSCGCADSAVDVANTAAASEIVNTHCPIMGAEVDPADLDPSMVKEWNGKKVGFCCPPCLEEWDELTDVEKAEKLSHPGEDHSHGTDAAAESSTETPAPLPAESATTPEPATDPSAQ